MDASAENSNFKNLAHDMKHNTNNILPNKNAIIHDKSLIDVEEQSPQATNSKKNRISSNNLLVTKESTQVSGH